MSQPRPASVSIDVGAIVARTLAPLRPNLVTRPTGRAVRAAIEERLRGAARAPFVSLIDFTRIRVLDFSCADEIVAKLLVRYMKADRPRDVFFLFRAVGEVHGQSVEQVLRRHGLAAVCDYARDGFRLLGSVSERERTAWQTLEVRRRIGPAGVADALGTRGDTLLRRLAERRLVFREPNGTALALSALSTSHM